MISRRSLLTHAMATAATLATGGVMAAAATAPTRLRLIGHTGITWGYSADNAPDAIRDVGELGFHGFESFGSVLQAWDARGGLQERLLAKRLQLIGAYCPLNLTDSTKRTDELKKAILWSSLISSYGGRVAVIGPDNVDRRSFNFAAARADILTTLNGIGMVMTAAGLNAALHPHTGSCIQTRDEIRAVMDGSNARDVLLCPDTGELMAAGVDPLDIIRQYGERIAHVHIKDYNGGAQHDGYTAVGRGKVNIPAVMDAIEALPQAFMVMVELNPDAALNKSDPATPRKAAAGSKASLEKLGYRFKGEQA